MRQTLIKWRGFGSICRRSSAVLEGDFSGPSHIHGQKHAGIGELRAASPGQQPTKTSKVGAADTYTAAPLVGAAQVV